MTKYRFEQYIDLSKDIYFIDLIQQNIDKFKSSNKIQEALTKLYKDLPMQIQGNIETFLYTLHEYAELNVLEKEKCPIVAKHFKDICTEAYRNKVNLDSYILFDIFIVFILYLAYLSQENVEYAKYLGARNSNSILAITKHNFALKGAHAKAIGTFLKFKHQGYSLNDAIDMCYHEKKLTIAQIVYLQKQVEE